MGTARWIGAPTDDDLRSVKLSGDEKRSTSFDDESKPKLVTLINFKLTPREPLRGRRDRNEIWQECERFLL